MAFKRLHTSRDSNGNPVQTPADTRVSRNTWQQLQNERDARQKGTWQPAAPSAPLAPYAARRPSPTPSAHTGSAAPAPRTPQEHSANSIPAAPRPIITHRAQSLTRVTEAPPQATVSPENQAMLNNQATPFGWACLASAITTNPLQFEGADERRFLAHLAQALNCKETKNAMKRWNFDRIFPKILAENLQRIVARNAVNGDDFYKACEFLIEDAPFDPERYRLKPEIFEKVAVFADQCLSEHGHLAGQKFDRRLTL